MHPTLLPVCEHSTLASQHSFLSHRLPSLPRRAHCGSVGPRSLPAASGWAWSWTSLRARMMAALGAFGTSSAPPSRVSLTWGPRGVRPGVHSAVLMLLTGKRDGGWGLRAEAWTTPGSNSVLVGLFASVSKISKAVDAPPSSVTSTPRTPRMDFSRVTGKGRREHKGQRGDPCGGKSQFGDVVGVAQLL